MKEYDITGVNNPADPLGAQGQTGILSGLDDGFGYLLFGDSNASSSIMGELTGYNAQQREFQQQEYLLEKEQAWNSEEARMRRMKAAGINPNVAASGIAGGSSNASAPAVPSAAGGAAAGLSAASQLAGTIGDNALKSAQAKEIEKQLEPNIQNTIADTFWKYKQAGYTDLQAQGLSIANAYLSTEKFLGIVALNENINVLQGQWKNLQKDIEVKNARIKEIDKHIEEMGASISLQEKEALLAEKKCLQIDQETIEAKFWNDTRQQYGIDPRNPIENNLLMLGVTGNPNYDSSLKIVYESQYKRSLGEYDADKSTAYERAHAAAKGVYNADPYQAQYSELYDNIDKMYTLRDDMQNIVTGAKEALDAGKLSAAEYKEIVERYSSYIKELDKDIKEANKRFAKGAYQMGHKKLNESILEDAAKIGIGVGAYGLTQPGKPAPIGFNR